MASARAGAAGEQPKQRRASGGRSGASVKKKRNFGASVDWTRKAPRSENLEFLSGLSRPAVGLAHHGIIFSLRLSSELETEITELLGSVPVGPRSHDKLEACSRSLRQGSITTITLHRQSTADELGSGLQLQAEVRGTAWTAAMKSPLAGGLRITGTDAGSPAAEAERLGSLKVGDIVTKLGDMKCLGSVKKADLTRARCFPSGEQRLEVTLFHETAAAKDTAPMDIS